VNVEILPASITDKPALERLMELYCYDFSAFDGADVDAHGRFGYPFLDLYWSEQGRHPFLLRVDGNLAGFVLVNKHTLLPDSEWSIAEFFVMRKYRRHGLGQRAAHFVFDQFRGRWEVAQIASNLEAQLFWRKVIGEYTGGKFEEFVFDDEQWKGSAQVFENMQHSLL
jgi:predicted acetyltransferase